MAEHGSTSDGRFSFSEIFDYVNSGKYPDNYDKNDKRALRKRASNFSTKDGSLYYSKLAAMRVHFSFCLIYVTSLMLVKEDCERLVVEDKAQRGRIISSVHDSNHLGINRTTDQIVSKYYWPGITNDIKLYVSYNT